MKPKNRHLLHLEAVIKSALLSFVLASLFLSVGGEVLYAEKGKDKDDPTPTPTSSPTPSPSPTPQRIEVKLCHAEPQSGPPINKYDLITVDDDGSAGNVNYKGHDHHSRDIIPAPNGVCPLIFSPSPSPTPTDSGSTPTPTPSPTPTSLPTDSPTATPTLTPSPTPTSTPTPEPTSSGGVGGVSDSGSGGGSVLASSTNDTQSQVLGAKTLAATGSGLEELSNFSLVGGLIFISLGIMKYARFQKAYRQA